MATTLTRYLKLRIADDLSADAKYNLLQIDGLGATFNTDNTAQLNVKSVGNILIEPESPDVGGSGNGSGVITLGEADNKAEVVVHSTFFRLRSALSLLNLASTATNYLSVSFSNSSELVSPQSLTIDVGTGDRTISFPVDGEVVTTTATQTVTNKDITGTFTGPLTGNVTGNLTGNVTGNVTGNLAGDVTGNADTATDLNSGSILSISKGGTGNDGSDRTTALLSLLPNPAGQDEKVLRYNNGTLEWYLASGTGTVQSVGLSLPSEFAVTNSPVQSIGTLTAAWNNAPAGQVFSGPASVSGTPSFRALVASDIPSGIPQSQISNLVLDLAGKEPAIAAGTVGQYWSGDKSWATLDKASVGLSNVDNTSDVNKPISSDTQTALNAKYDASNPASYVDAGGAKAASVTTNINDVDQTLAPDCTAVKGYVASAGGAMSFNWAAGTPASPIGGIYYKTITHNLNSLYLTVTVLDNAEEIIWVDSIVPADVNSVILGSSQQPPSSWTVIVRPAPAP